MPKSDQRATPRVAVNVPATIQILGPSAAENARPANARIVDASARGLRLLAGAPIAPGQVVKVETAESMFLGEVCYCAAQGGEGYAVGIAAEQCLTGVGDLEHLIRALAPETARELQRR